MSLGTKKFRERLTDQITVPLIGGAVRPPQHIDPEFVDCKGLEAGWGIKRTLAYSLLADGLIRGVSLRRRGQLRGKRLFDVASVRAFLRSQMENCGYENEAEAIRPENIKENL